MLHQLCLAPDIFNKVQKKLYDAFDRVGCSGETADDDVRCVDSLSKVARVRRAITGHNNYY